MSQVMIAIALMCMPSKPHHKKCQEQLALCVVGQMIKEPGVNKKVTFEKFDSVAGKSLSLCVAGLNK